ncbi:enkurin domain-containing protein 1-like isoform X3 [Bolinopsis microptera]|uniref:enkurin domain-containing protein 1-like isoform X3 n=1 Tax=Bolinopsis microptera TaxID=2820187 RepID=UPI00307AA065
MGNLLNSYNQNKGYMDEPIRKRLAGSDAQDIAHKNIHGSMSNILQGQNERSIKSMSQPAPGVPRLKTSDALDIQNKSLNGSMSGILNVSQGGGKVPGSQLNPHQVRAKFADAQNNVQYGNNGTIGALVLNPGSTNVCDEKGKYNEGVTRALKAEVAQPAPRVRPEAAEIANQHKGFIKNLIVDVSNKPKQVRKSASVDQLNYNRMKKKEKEGQKKMQPSDSKPLWKNSKYERTESRLKQWMDATYGAGSRPGTPASRPGSAGGKKPAPAAQTKPAGGALKKSASDSCLKRNFVAENAKKARAAPIRVDPMKLHDRKVAKKKENVRKSYQRGTVPDYLKERVSQWKEEEIERIANLPDPTVPDGHVVMDPKEKDETLAVLTKSREKLLLQLQNMPLRNDTLRRHNTRNQLESKIGEIDDAIKIFSRPRVFIKQE